jgi:DNA-directed RNA polymerase specialized sigma24 family protein
MAAIPERSLLTADAEDRRLAAAVSRGDELAFRWLARVAHQQLAKAWRHRHREPTLVSLAEVSEFVGAVEPDTVLEESLDAALLMLDHDER